MDQQKLRTLVFEKTGVRIDIDDPIFALVALNEAVLAEAVERHVAMIDDASADLADHLQALEDNGSTCRYVPAAAGKAASAAVVCKAASAASVGAAASTPAQSALRAPDERRAIALAAGAALLGALLVLLGQAAFFGRAPAPATATLSAQQEAALKNAEKLTLAVQRLDPKVRTAIDAEMQKP